ncbi:MAG: NDP-hexose 4-ketoreductase, partial [Actinomycetota bacterium]|nr:NDP-hexose 4-ketoreductase [Actinomycetota bacterium]
FHELTIAEVVQIVDLMIRRVREQLEGQGIGLELTPEAKEHIAGKGYEPALGARPLRRAIQQLVEDPLSEKILWKEFRVGETIIVDLEEGSLVFKAIEGFEPPPVELAGAGAPET